MYLGIMNLLWSKWWYYHRKANKEENFGRYLNCKINTVLKATLPSRWYYIWKGNAHFLRGYVGKAAYQWKYYQFSCEYIVYTGWLSCATVLHLCILRVIFDSLSYFYWFIIPTYFFFLCTFLGILGTRLRLEWRYLHQGSFEKDIFWLFSTVDKTIPIVNFKVKKLNLEFIIKFSSSTWELLHSPLVDFAFIVRFFRI